MKTKHKFKAGDKVRILPLAIEDGVSHKACNQVGSIIRTRHPTFPGYCTVKMEKPELNNGCYNWAVSPCNITLVIKKGEQLLFAFMEEGE